MTTRSAPATSGRRQRAYTRYQAGGEVLPHGLPRESLRHQPQATGLPWSAVIPQPENLNHMYQPILAQFEGRTVPRFGKTQVAKSWALAATLSMKTQGAPILLPKTPVTIVVWSYFDSAKPDIDAPLKPILDALQAGLGRPHAQARLVKRKAGLVPECWNDRYVSILLVGKFVDATNPRVELTVADFGEGVFARMAAEAVRALPLLPVPAPSLAQLS